jgi:hypothetical protein
VSHGTFKPKRLNQSDGSRRHRNRLGYM